jgi:hypothetical protein
MWSADVYLYIYIQAASAAIGASTQKHVYIRYMPMFVIIYVPPNSMPVLCVVVVDVR